MKVYVLIYCYPDGSYAGLIGVYNSYEKAKANKDANQAFYSDCTFVISSSEMNQ